MKIYTLLLISSLTLLGSCGIYDRYTPEKPELLSDNLYRDVPSADTSNLGNLGWRALFTDPLLQTLIEKGLANNTDLRVAQQTVIQAAAMLKTARLSCCSCYINDYKKITCLRLSVQKNYLSLRSKILVTCTNI